MVFVCLLLQKKFAKIYSFLVLKDTILHYSYVAGLQISSVGW